MDMKELANVFSQMGNSLKKSNGTREITSNLSVSSKTVLHKTDQGAIVSADTDDWILSDRSKGPSKSVAVEVIRRDKKEAMNEIFKDWD